MSWLNLREDIEGVFAELEGCGLPTSNSDDDNGGFPDGFGIWDPEKEADHKREFQREYEKRPERKAALAKWRIENKVKINASARARAKARAA